MLSKTIQQNIIAFWKLTATTARLIKLAHPPLPGIHSGLGQVPLNQTLPTANNPCTLALHQHELLAQASETQRSLLCSIVWRNIFLAAFPMLPVSCLANTKNCNVVKMLWPPMVQHVSLLFFLSSKLHLLLSLLFNTIGKKNNLHHFGCVSWSLLTSFGTQIAFVVCDGFFYYCRTWSCCHNSATTLHAQ